MDTIDEHATEILLDGRYRLGPCLGRGGMAVVYRAEDTFLGRTVAIKLLGRADEAPSAMERVHSETTVLASLNHPSLVTLYDARLDPGHAQYLAMEYIDGPTLASRLTQGPLSGQEAAAFARDLSEALQVVHDAGIIHRDVKPSNVMLARASRREAGWTAKLTDFGIAYSLSEPRVTSPGGVVGTAAYMAPEQVRGAELTPAVDIYSLGLVLIEALTGEPAFPMMGQVPTALRRLAETPVIPDSVGPRWGALLARMTRVVPEERPSASEVAQAAAFLCDAPSSDGERTAPQPAPTVLMPIMTDGPTTGPTQEIATAAAPPTVRRRAARKLRAGALSTMAVVAAAMIIVAGIWAFSPPGESPGRVASRTSAGEAFTPTSPETDSPPESDQTDTSTNTDTESDINDEPVDDVTEGGPDERSDENSNKGPGNNSGNEKDPSDDDKDNGKKGK
ncbi:serine/threonine-protein kinase [Microbacterium sp. AK031]|uniref:serine/threonine-protein kinase n=1 Tax=Microbacterium sp. AK031 TaxID=2723076 RepID=UPI002169BAB5|nr:serine/threonine-protein kinase [Microbacterium sp. AK031]MCS3843625.1 serine/threonine protein kinase [Microbacterium sp. AK031]